MLQIATRLFLGPAFRRPLVMVLTIVSVAAGAALPVAGVVAADSVTRSGSVLYTTIDPSAQLRVDATTWDGGLSVDAVQQIETAVPGATTTPLITAVALAVAPGHDPAPLLVLGLPCAAGDAATDAIPCGARSTAVDGSTVILTSTASVPLSEYAPSTALDDLDLGLLVTMPIEEVQAHFGRRDTVDTVLVRVPDGPDGQAGQALRESLEGRARVVDIDEPPLGSGLTVERLTPVLRILGIANLSIGAVLGYQALALFVTERRRQLATMLAVGVRNRHLMSAGALLGAIVGVFGGLGGVALGSILARDVVNSIDRVALRASGLHSELHLSSGLLIGAAVLGAVNGAAAGLLAVRSVARRPLAESLGSRTPDPTPLRGLRFLAPALVGTTSIGLLLGWLGGQDGSLEAWQPLAALGGLGMAVTSTMLLTGILAGPSARPLRRLGAKSGTLRGLAVSTSVLQWRRTGILVTVAATAVATAVISSSFGESSAAAATGAAVELRTDEWVRVSSTDVPERGPIEPRATDALVERLRSTSGVGRVDRLAHLVTMTPGGTSLCLIGIEGELPAYAFHDGARVDALDDGDVLLGAGLARAVDANPGTTIQLATPTGPVDARVQAVWADGRCQSRSVTATWAQVQVWYGAVPPAELWIEPSGATATALIATLEPMLSGTGLRATSSAETARAARSFSDDLISITDVMQRGLLAVTAAAIASSFLLSLRRRRGQLAVLLAYGTERWRVGLLLVTEAVVVGIAGMAFGLATGLAGLVGYRNISALLFGWPIPFRVDVGAAITSSLVAVAVAVAASVAAAVVASRIDVVDALRSE